MVNIGGLTQQDCSDNYARAGSKTPHAPRSLAQFLCRSSFTLSHYRLQPSAAGELSPSKHFLLHLFKPPWQPALLGLCFVQPPHPPGLLREKFLLAPSQSPVAPLFASLLKNPSQLAYSGLLLK